MSVLVYRISRKSDQNCGRDSATVFSINMATVTSSDMLMSKKINDRNNNLQMIVCGKFHFDYVSRFSLKTNRKKLKISTLLKFDRYFNGHYWPNALNMHIFLLSGSRSVRIDILFSNSRHFRF